MTCTSLPLGFHVEITPGFIGIRWKAPSHPTNRGDSLSWHLVYCPYIQCYFTGMPRCGCGDFPLFSRTGCRSRCKTNPKAPPAGLALLRHCWEGLFTKVRKDSHLEPYNHPRRPENTVHCRTGASQKAPSEF